MVDVSFALGVLSALAVVPCVGLCVICLSPIRGEWRGSVFVRGRRLRVSICRAFMCPASCVVALVCVGCLVGGRQCG